MRQFVKCMVSSNNRDVFRSSVYFLTSKSLAKPHLNTSQAIGSHVLDFHIPILHRRALHSTLPLAARINKPPLSENQNIEVLRSRKLFVKTICYYFDLMKNKDDGRHFLKISEVDIKTKERSHLLVFIEDLGEVINILINGQYEAFADGEPFEIFTSNVDPNKSYDFSVWDRRIYKERSHIEIIERGSTHANLIKNRDPDTDTGVFHIIISKGNLKAFVNELDEILIDVNDIMQDV